MTNVGSACINMSDPWPCAGGLHPPDTPAEPQEEYSQINHVPRSIRLVAITTPQVEFLS